MWLSAAFLVLLALCALFPGLLAPSNPLVIHPTAVLKGVSARHPLGTDQYGRDMLSQLIYGTRASLVIGIVSVLAGGSVGAAIGIIAGYIGGPADAVSMRFIDVLMCFPGILLALVFEAALGPGLTNEIVAVAVASVPTYARVMRGQTLAIRSRPFVLAARTGGVRARTILRRHVLPNVLSTLVVLATIGLGISMVLGASLSFLGLGPAGGEPDWGRLVGNGEQYLGNAWWITTFPGLAITLVVVAVNVLGDGLRERLDPTTR
jgi:peptide/nickel transport system permease protein